MERRNQIVAMLNPSSLALVGATESSAWSAALVGNLRLHGYQGRIHLVNPRHQTQFGLPCHSSVSARHGFASARGPPRHEETML